MMKYSLSTGILILSWILSGFTAEAQDTLFHAPSQDNLRKGFVIQNLQTGTKDTIYAGSYVKLWIRSEKKLNKLQPLTKMDFNRHTGFYESILVTMTDSHLLLLRKPPIPFLKSNKPFDTIAIKDIIGFRAFNKNVEMSTTSAVTMPGMSFMPSEVMEFPYMFILMPVMQSITQVGSSIINPIHKIRTKKGERYKLSIEEHQADSLFYVLDGPALKQGEYEWEVDKHKRWEKVNSRAERILEQRLLADNTGNKVFSVTFGSMFFPGYVRGPSDTKTHIKIADNAFVFGFTSERYISPRSRIGLEMQFNIPPRTASFNGTTFKGGSGFINSIFSYMKLGIGGTYGTQLRNNLLKKSAIIDADSNDIDRDVRLARMQRLIMMEPKLYFQFGAGAVTTTLLRIKGNVSSGSISATDYSQKKFSVHAGFGLSSRISKRLLYDMSVKYVFSPNYQPSLGGLKSYSGIKLQFNFGYVFGPGFALRKRILKEVSDKNQ